MSLVNENGGMVMPVGPMYGNGGNGFGLGNDGSFWIIILFLFAMFGNGWGGFGGNGGLVTTNNDMQRGFDQQSIMNGINGINSALANAEVSRCNAQANILQTLNNNQSAANQAMNAIAMSLQNCCCENRSNIADLKYTVATEACADRQAVTDNTQLLLNTINGGIQSIQDKLCQQEIDALKTQNANLQTQINMANLAASQTAQTARILQDNAAQTVALEQYLNPVAVPAYIVQNPNCCAQNYSGCGC